MKHKRIITLVRKKFFCFPFLFFNFSLTYLLICAFFKFFKMANTTKNESICFFFSNKLLSLLVLISSKSLISISVASRSLFCYFHLIALFNLKLYFIFSLLLNLAHFFEIMHMIRNIYFGSLSAMPEIKHMLRTSFIVSFPHKNRPTTNTKRTKLAFQITQHMAHAVTRVIHRCENALETENLGELMQHFTPLGFCVT